MFNFIKSKISGIKIVEDLSYNNEKIIDEIKAFFINYKGISLFESQIYTAIELSKNTDKVFQIETGEGKTYILAIAALIKALNGEKSIIVTPSDFLAEEAFFDVKVLFKHFSINIDILKYNGSPENIISDKNTVVYTSHQSLAALFLNNELNIHFDMYKFQNDFNLLIDEIDVILVEDNINRFSIAEAVNYDTTLLEKFKDIYLNFIPGENNDFYGSSDNIVLTKKGEEKLFEMFGIDFYDYENYIKEILTIENILISILIKEQNEYLIENNRIAITNKETGKTKQGAVFKDGIQQTVEFFENIEITSSRKKIAEIDYANLVKSFKGFTGVSGSVENFVEIFSILYKKQIIKIRKNHISKIIKKQDILFANKENQFAFLFEKIKTINLNTSSILIGAQNIAEAKILLSYLNAKMKNNVNLLEFDDKKNTELVKFAGHPGAITIITPTNGRGLNIRNNVLLKDGMFFIGVGRNKMPHLDYQMESRVGRSGDLAEILWLVSPEDSLFDHQYTKHIKNKMLSFNLDDNFASSRFVSKLIFEAQNIMIDFIKESNVKQQEDNDILNYLRLFVNNKRSSFLSKAKELNMFGFTQYCKDIYFNSFNEEDLVIAIENDFGVKISSNDDFVNKMNIAFNAWIETVGIEQLESIMFSILEKMLNEKSFELITIFETEVQARWLQDLNPNKNSSLEFKKNCFSAGNKLFIGFEEDFFKKMLISLKFR